MWWLVILLSLYLNNTITESAYCDITVCVNPIVEKLKAPENQEKLKIECNVNIEKLQRKNFDKCQNLTRLNLTGKITTVENDALNDLAALEVIDLSNNGIKYLQILNFENILTNLQTILLNGNQLTNINIKYVKSLQKLILSRNNIGVLNNETFVNLPHIILIDLSNNNIRKIMATTFDSCRMLNILNLNDNQLENIEEGTFHKMPQLKYLYINNNKLTKIPSNYFNLPRLETLELKHNSIRHIDGTTFYNLPNLYSLILSRNKISELASNLLQKNKNLSTFNATHNNISVIHNELFRCTNNLMSLHLDFNSIKKFRVESKLHLKSVSLAHNHISLLDWSQKTQENIVYLNLAHNKLANLKTESFNNLLSLETLSLEDNKLKEFSICVSTHLRSLDLSQNQLIDVKLMNLCNDNTSAMLSEVNLSYNDLSSVDLKDLGKSQRNLEVIDLRHNPLNKGFIEIIKHINIFKTDLILIDEPMEKKTQNVVWIVVGWILFIVTLSLAVAGILYGRHRRLKSTSKENIYNDVYVNYPQVEVTVRPPMIINKDSITSMRSSNCSEDSTFYDKIDLTKGAG